MEKNKRLTVGQIVLAAAALLAFVLLFERAINVREIIKNNYSAWDMWFDGDDYLLLISFFGDGLLFLFIAVGAFFYSRQNQAISVMLFGYGVYLICYCINALITREVVFEQALFLFTAILVTAGGAMMCFGKKIAPYGTLAFIPYILFLIVLLNKNLINPNYFEDIDWDNVLILFTEVVLFVGVILKYVLPQKEPDWLVTGYEKIYWIPMFVWMLIVVVARMLLNV